MNLTGWGARARVHPSPPPLYPPRRLGWFIVGGVILVGLLGVVVVLVRNILLASFATVVVVTTTPVVSTTAVTQAPTSTPVQQLDAYISHMTQQQKIGQLLMLGVYTDGYSSALDGPLRDAQVGGVVFFPNHNGGPLMPTTLAGAKQLLSDIQAHATNPLLVATDEERGGVDRLAPYYGASPAPSTLTATGDPRRPMRRPSWTRSGCKRWALTSILPHWPMSIKAALSTLVACLARRLRRSRPTRARFWMACSKMGLRAR